MNQPNVSSDLRLIRSLIAGDDDAWDLFVTRCADVVWSACLILNKEKDEARSAFNDVFKALMENQYERLRTYDGSSKLTTFVSLIAREAMAERLMRSISLENKDTAWRSFHAFFGQDIERIVKRRVPGVDNEDLRRDISQDVFSGLSEDGFRRLKAYSGSGSFSGFVLQTADRLTIDSLRKDLPRRRLPAAILRLPSIDQEIFKLACWEGINDPSVIKTKLAKAGHVTDTSSVSKGLDMLSPHIADGAPRKSLSIESLEEHPSNDPDPEASLIARQEEAKLQSAILALREVVKSLGPAEQLYVRIAMGGSEPLAPREVARLMGRPVDEIYRIKRKVLSLLKESLESESAVKSWRASV